MSVSNDPRLLSTADVRNGFAGAAVSHSDMLRRAAEFDAWLAEHDRALQAAAWNRLSRWLDDHDETDVRASVKHAAKWSNPFRKPADGGC